MERNLLVGNGINIQFGGLDVYSASATMNEIANPPAMLGRIE